MTTHPAVPRSARTALGLLLAGAATLAVWNRLPATDPLRTTLRVMPLVAAALVWLAGRIELAGGRRLRPAPGVFEGALAMALAVAVATRSSWLPRGVGGLDRVLVAVLSLLLAHRFLRLVLAARPLMMHTRRPRAVFFLLPAIAYLALLPWQSGQRSPDGDEPYYLLIAHSLAHDGDLDLADNYRDGDDVIVGGRELEPQPGDPVGEGGEVFSRHNLLLPLLVAPAYRLLGVPGALIMMALFAAAACWKFLDVGRRYLPAAPGELLLAYSVLATSAPLVGYSYQVWVEVPAALGLLIGLSTVHSIGERGATRAKALALAGVVVALPLLKARFVVLSISLLVVALVRTRSWRGLRRIAAILAGAVALVLAANVVLFGNPLKYHDASALLASLANPGAYVRGLAGLLFDCAFGLFAAAPIWMLVLPGLASLWARHRRLAVDTAIVGAPYLLLVAPRLEWYGGWGPPFRYAMVLLPCLALALVPALADRRRRGVAIAIAALAMLSVGTTLVAVVAPGTTFSFADGRSLVLDALTTIAGVDYARFFPSYTRPRLASWIWPVAVSALLFVSWRIRGTRLSTRRSRMGGALVVLLGAAALFQAAEHLPTATIELEDPVVEQRGGELYPDRWRPARPAYRGGWLLEKGHAVSLRPIAGGSKVTIELELRAPRVEAGPVAILFSQGDRLLCRAPIDSTQRWVTVTCGSVEWSAGGAALTLRLDPSNRRRRPRVILDRASFDWHS